LEKNGAFQKPFLAFMHVCNRVARFFLVHDTKTGKMYQMNTKLYQMVLKCPRCPYNIPNSHKIYQHFPI
jgi:hypothetical protein